MTLPKLLISIGDAWVDPEAVIGVDSHFTDIDPAWPAVRVTLRTGQVIYGTRDPKRVAVAVRTPDQDRYDEAREAEIDGASPETAADRARRRHRAQPPAGGPSPLRPVEDDQ